MTIYEDKITELAKRDLWMRPADKDRKEIYENRYDLMIKCDLWKLSRMGSLIQCWGEGDDIERMDDPRYYKTTRFGYVITSSTPKDLFTGVVPGFRIVPPIATLEDITVVQEFKNLQAVREATKLIKRAKRLKT